MLNMAHHLKHHGTGRYASAGRSPVKPVRVPKAGPRVRTSADVKRVNNAMAKVCKSGRITPGQEAMAVLEGAFIVLP